MPVVDQQFLIETAVQRCLHRCTDRVTLPRTAPGPAGHDGGFDDESALTQAPARGGRPRHDRRCRTARRVRQQSGGWPRNRLRRHHQVVGPVPAQGKAQQAKGKVKDKAKKLKDDLEKDHQIDEDC